MSRTLSRVGFLTAALALVLAPTAAQPPTADRTIDAAERTAVIDGVLEKVESNYVFPEVGTKMASGGRRHVRPGHLRGGDRGPAQERLRPPGGRHPPVQLLLRRIAPPQRHLQPNHRHDPPVLESPGRSGEETHREGRLRAHQQPDV